MKYGKITKIEVTFAQGSFANWATSNDSHPPAFVAEWEENYNRLIEEEIKKVFPNAEVSVGEGYDQLMETQVSIDWDDNILEDGIFEVYEWVGEVETTVFHLLNEQVDRPEIWADPSMETVARAIEGVFEGRLPFGSLEYQGARFAFTREGEYGWVDLDVEENILQTETADWDWGSLEEAAVAFWSEVDPEFSLITQAEAVEAGAPSVQAVNNAIRDGRLRGYQNPQAKTSRQGATLVSEQEVKNIWGK